MQLSRTPLPSFSFILGPMPTHEVSIGQWNSSPCNPISPKDVGALPCSCGGTAFCLMGEHHSDMFTSYSMSVLMMYLAPFRTLVPSCNKAPLPSP